MLRKIRDLDFDAIIARIAAKTNPERRIACSGPVQNELAFVRSPADAITSLRDYVMLAVLRHTQTLEDIRFEEPLVQALVRVQHHPLVEPIPAVKVQEAMSGPDAGPRLREIVEAHAELGYDLDAVQQLIIRGIREGHGDHQLDDAEPPWLMHWSPASKAATALIVLVTLRALGDI